MSATDSPPGPDETDKTGETVLVSNDEFLRTLFGSLSSDVAPVVTSFGGNPANVAKSAWQSRRWRDDGNALPHEANNYFNPLRLVNFTAYIPAFANISAFFLRNWSRLITRPLLSVNLSISILFALNSFPRVAPSMSS